jgi:tRNA pseudouridine55 synthase
MVSAIKKDGVPLYKLARRGQTVERPPRLIHVYAFDRLTWDPPRARFRLSCTKGTYVRTLVSEIGEELGCGAFLEELRRTASGGFRADRAVPLSDLLQRSAEDLPPLVIPISEAVRDAG